MLVWLISWNYLSLHHIFSCSLLVIIRSCEWSDGPPEEGVTQPQAFTTVSTIYVGKPWTWWSKDREGLRVASTVNGHRHRISPLPFKQLICVQLMVWKWSPQYLRSERDCWVVRQQWATGSKSHHPGFASRTLNLTSSQFWVGILWLGSEDAQSRNWQLSWFIWAMFSFLKTSSFRALYISPL